MKIVKNVAAQGEMLIRRVNAFTEEAKDYKPENDVFILAHSETGHHHVIDRDNVEVKEQTKNVPQGMAILQLIVKEPAEIKHLRPTDTHESLQVDKGLWEIRLQREYTPKGYRRVAD